MLRNILHYMLMSLTAKEQKVDFLVNAAHSELEVAMTIFSDPELTLKQKNLEMGKHAELGIEYLEAADSLIPPKNPRLFIGQA